MLFIQHPADIPGHSFDDFLINTYVFSGYIPGKLLLKILLHFLAGFKNRLRFFGAGEQDLPPVPRQPFLFAGNLLLPAYPHEQKPDSF